MMPEPSRRRLALAALLGANAIPLAGALWLGWQVADILLLYWLETAVIAVGSMARMGRAAGRRARTLVPFFVVHAGLFMLVHFVFLYELFLGDSGSTLRERGGRVGLALLALGIQEAAATWSQWPRGEALRDAMPQRHMGSFYGRIIVMHLTLILGGWFALSAGEPRWAIVVLVLVKAGVDAGMLAIAARNGAPRPTGA
jgi:hypothetical protein